MVSKYDTTLSGSYNVLYSLYTVNLSMEWSWVSWSGTTCARALPLGSCAFSNETWGASWEWDLVRWRSAALDAWRSRRWWLPWRWWWYMAGAASRVMAQNKKATKKDKWKESIFLDFLKNSSLSDLICWMLVDIMKTQLGLSTLIYTYIPLGPAAPFHLQDLMTRGSLKLRLFPCFNSRIQSDKSCLGDHLPGILKGQHGPWWDNLVLKLRATRNYFWRVPPLRLMLPSSHEPFDSKTRFI